MAEEFSINALKNIFAEIDLDGSGVIDFVEFRTGLHRIGVRLDKERTRQIFDTIDDDGSGAIDSQELISFLENENQKGLVEEFKETIRVSYERKLEALADKQKKKERAKRAKEEAERLRKELKAEQERKAREKAEELRREEEARKEIATLLMKLHPLQVIEFDSDMIYVQPEDQEEDDEKYPYFIEPSQLDDEEEEEEMKKAEKQSEDEDDSESEEEPIEELIQGTSWEDLRLTNLPWTIDVSEEVDGRSYYEDGALNDADRIRVEKAMILPRRRAGDDMEDDERRVIKPREIRDAITVIGYRRARAKNQEDREKWRFTVGCFSSDVSKGHLSVLEPNFLVTQIGERNVLNYSRKQAFEAIIRETLTRREGASGMCKITYVPTTFRRTCEFQEMHAGEWKTGLVLQHKMKKGGKGLFARIQYGKTSQLLRKNVPVSQIREFDPFNKNCKPEKRPETRIVKFKSCGRRRMGQRIFDEWRKVQDRVYRLDFIACWVGKDYVAGIQFIYETYDGSVLRGKTIVGREGGGADIMAQNYQVPRGEYIVRLEVWSGDEYIERLRFVTQNGSETEFGEKIKRGSKKYVVSCRIGWEIICIHGAVHNYLTQIGAYKRELPKDLEEATFEAARAPMAPFPIVGTKASDTTTFDDRQTFSQSPRLASITIAYGNFIYGLQSFYENDLGALEETLFHGQSEKEEGVVCNPPRDGIAQATLHFSPDVVITQIDTYERDRRICGLKMYTSDNKARMIGNCGDKGTQKRSMVAPFGRCICCFRGGFDKISFQLFSVYFGPLPELTGYRREEEPLRNFELVSKTKDLKTEIEAVPVQSDIFGDPVPKATNFDDIMTFGRATFLDRLTVYSGPSPVGVNEKRIYGFQFDYIDQNGESIPGKKNYHEHSGLQSFSMKFNPKEFIYSVKVSVMKQTSRKGGELKGFVTGLLIQTSDGGQRKIGQLGGQMRHFRNLPGRQVAAFHGSYSRDGLHRLGVWYATVRGVELKVVKDANEDQEEVTRVKLPFHRRRESRTVIDHTLDAYLFRDIKVQGANQ